MIIRMRNRCYDLKIFSVKRVKTTVISVGNISVGGSGKTPFVEMLVRMLSRRGKKVAVISRGYGRSTIGTLVVSDGTTLLETVQRSGDEAYQVARKFPGVVVIVDEQRARAAQIVAGKFAVDVIVLDDGFQHRALHRDLDIVMVHGGTPLSSMRLLPSGLQREPLSSLDRAHLLAISFSSDGRVNVTELQKYTSASVIKVRHKPKELVLLVGNRRMKLLEARGRNCIACCGIGSPESFRHTVREAGLKVDDCMVFPDHHKYTASDLRNIEENASSLHAEIIITTEKDAVRLEPLIKETVSLMKRFYYLEVEMEIMEDAEILDRALDSTLKKVA